MSLYLLLSLSVNKPLFHLYLYAALFEMSVLRSMEEVNFKIVSVNISSLANATINLTFILLFHAANLAESGNCSSCAFLRIRTDK